MEDSRIISWNNAKDLPRNIVAHSYVKTPSQMLFKGWIFDPKAFNWTSVFQSASWLHLKIVDTAFQTNLRNLYSNTLFSCKNKPPAQTVTIIAWICHLVWMDSKNATASGKESFASGIKETLKG